MPEFTVSSAARAVGISRASIQRAIKSGRLSATVNAAGERVIDLSELLRVFGPLKGEAERASMDGEHARERLATPPEQVFMSGEQAALDALREHLNDAREQLRTAQEREVRLLALLEAEQQARRDLETKLLPAPGPAPVGKVRVWALVIVLLVALSALMVALIHPEMVGRLTGG